MSVFIARHGLSFANDRESPAFGSADASLMQEGREDARFMGTRFKIQYDIKPAVTPAAVSTLNRSQESAIEAGFAKRIIYPSLDEVAHWNNIPDLRTLLRRGQLPPTAAEKAEAILEDPPTERVWITHGLVIAGLCAALGIYQEERLIPGFCEIRELPIETAAIS